MLQFEVAGTIIQLEDTDAALVVYCPASWQGEIIHIQEIYPSEKINHFATSASVIGRPVGDQTIYAAIFSRIQCVSDYALKNTNVRTTQAEVWAFRGWKRTIDIGLYLGNVTELDWTNKD